MLTAHARQFEKQYAPYQSHLRAKISLKYHWLWFDLFSNGRETRIKSYVPWDTISCISLITILIEGCCHLERLFLMANFLRIVAIVLSRLLRYLRRDGEIAALSPRLASDSLATGSRLPAGKKENGCHSLSSLWRALQLCNLKMPPAGLNKEIALFLLP